MNRYNIIVEELKLPTYVAMTDQERFDSLILEDIESTTPISTVDIEMYLQSQDKLYFIYSHASDIAKEVVLVFDRFDSFDTGVTREKAVLTDALTALVTNSVITVAQGQAILASGDTLISRAVELGVNNLVLSEVIGART